MASLPSVVTVALWPKNSRENLRVALQEYRGAQLIDVRVTIPLAAHSEVQTPTKAGVALQVHMIPQLREALAAAEEQARSLGWLQ